MREAESQDVNGASAGGREAAARRSNVGLNLASSDDGDQEGVTLVDRDRVAMALRELRALGLTPARVSDDGQPHESPPPPPPPVAPIAGTSGLVAPLEPEQPRLGPSRGKKGQSSGILIAGVAVLVVALGAVAGAWSTRPDFLVTSPFGREANSRGLPSADRPQATLRGPISPAVVQAPLAAEAPPEAKAELRGPAPTSSPSAASRLLVPSAKAPRSQASAPRSKARAMQRQSPNSANRRKAIVAKVVTARLRSSHAAAPAAPPQIRIPEARHPSADPDATLPISE